MKIVAVKDKAIEAFGMPFVVQHTGQAIRSFIDELQNPDSQVGKHPEDYDLWEIGEFDEQTGLITGGEIRQIARGTDHAQKPER